MPCKVSIQIAYRDPFGTLMPLRLDYAINNNLTPFILCENYYNLLYREEEREMMPLLKHLGVGSTPWSPMARGRKHNQDPRMLKLTFQILRGR